MFKKNYGLEYPPPKKPFSKILFFILLPFVVYIVGCFIFYQVSLDKNFKSYQKLNNFSPDLIAVFTGHSGRIPLALKMAKKYPQAKIFITGVNKNNKPERLLELFDPELRPNMDIDYLARNTVENGLSTIRMLQKNPNLKNVLIISHDYHLIRINLIMNKLKTESEGYNLQFLGRKTDYANFRNIKILSKEVIKLIRTYFLFLFWSPG